ncbi:hypothetical protein G4X40_19940 [Rhodococcus sp. D2-41]|uniref:Uncharacterized protein n=1 Tax=Speluncibacter jeojiensis TaxID=2710754 RepID=A0A9X4LWF3_9ACTN|nr:hypothetical protein [Rhodococcus sp. D2-41]MDG3012415.1 hypothetical protein [Rhodococcus sp. D2-41]MDG3013590.1 hypothetical protein [Corynebacteriales bacterium D3-21]
MRVFVTGIAAEACQTVGCDCEKRFVLEVCAVSDEKWDALNKRVGIFARMFGREAAVNVQTQSLDVLPEQVRDHLMLELMAVQA